MKARQRVILSLSGLSLIGALIAPVSSNAVGPAAAATPEAGAATWGANDSGQLGDGTTIAHSMPKFAHGLGKGTGVVAVAGGFGSDSLAVKSDGAVLAWGRNDGGQLGDGTTTRRLSPVAVAGLGPGSGVVAVAAAYHSVALKADGTVLTWGTNVCGQLGDGSTTPRAVPMPVPGLGAGSGVVAIAVSYFSTLALKSNGKVLSWGSNEFGELGRPTTDACRGLGSPASFIPGVVTGLGAGSGVTRIAAGLHHGLALKSDGSVLAWGLNSYGQLGDGTTTARSTPTPVMSHGPGSGTVGVAAGGDHSLSLRSDGFVLAWGRNTSGELGDGTVVDHRALPVAVSGLGAGSGIVELAAGASHSLARKSDGSVRAWGNNSYGELGNGNTRSSSTPVVGAVRGATAISAGGLYSLAAGVATKVFIAPVAGAKGTSISVAGKNYLPGERVNVTYKTRLSSPANAGVCQATADSAGKFSCAGTIPTSNAGPTGQHGVTAKGLTSLGKAMAIYTLTAPVTILDDFYSPSTINVRAGDTVTWTSYAAHFHSVTSDTGLFDSSPTCPTDGCMGPSSTYEYTFSSPGTYNYHCKVHATMHGTVRVT